ncbi:hypothetical protein AGRO_0586 [Agrobacterium sp. ATCC 31749]|nr:hypothetical protein AGRO_0586 [Agrobacterium sp. ATCC 31749]
MPWTGFGAGCRCQTPTRKQGAAASVFLDAYDEAAVTFGGA